MTTALIVDTETTGIPRYKLPSDHEDQPRIVQLACKMIDIEERICLQSLNLIVFPSGWVIPKETTAIHGIDNHLAADVGVPQLQVVEMFLEIARKSDYFVAHNVPFDKRMIRIQIMRSLGRASADEFNNMPTICTMSKSAKGMGAGRYVALQKAHEHFCRFSFDDAHNAMADVEACERLFYALIDKGYMN